MAFAKAVKSKAKLKLWLSGPSGSGKTFSALRIAKGLGGRTALLDTENSRSCLYADRFDFDQDTLAAPHTPERYIEKIREVEAAGYDNLIIDSTTHEWKYILDAQSKLGGRYTDWKDVTPRHEKFVEAIVQSKLNIIVTSRAKTEYAQVLNSKGVLEPKEVGMGAVQRNDWKYEYLLAFDIDVDNHLAKATKDNTSMWADGIPFLITEEVGVRLKEWLENGAEPKPKCERCAVETETIIATDHGKKYCQKCSDEYEAYKLTLKQDAK